MPAAGTTSPLRRCDHIAWTRAIGHGLKFRPYLPEPERARALAAVVTWVRTRGLALNP